VLYALVSQCFLVRRGAEMIMACLTSGFHMRIVLCLLLFHRGVVVDKHERVVVFGIDVALRSLVSGTEIALLRP
jgi:hypothetical protein